MVLQSWFDIVWCCGCETWWKWYVRDEVGSRADEAEAFYLTRLGGCDSGVM